ncbi:hypothetical protein AwDysgo_05270 [Bacteroidales bacterium]|nr:hypothetical protein AwDysgo_05270 [Bacteroidales bacterium]
MKRFILLFTILSLFSVCGFTQIAHSELETKNINVELIWSQMQLIIDKKIVHSADINWKGLASQPENIKATIALYASYLHPYLLINEKKLSKEIGGYKSLEDAEIKLCSKWIENKNAVNKDKLEITSLSIINTEKHLFLCYVIPSSHKSDRIDGDLYKKNKGGKLEFLKSYKHINISKGEKFNKMIDRLEIQEKKQLTVF